MPNYTFDIEGDYYYGTSDDDSDDDNSDTMYEPEEQSLTKYNIVLCKQYDGNKHGVVSGEINNHHLTLVRFKELDMEYINLMSLFTSGYLEIAECLYLPSHHCVSIIKTHWLKLIQRTWKRICKDRKLTIARRCHPNALKYREINGLWPDHCINYPSLRGMLSKLSRTFSGTVC